MTNLKSLLTTRLTTTDGVAKKSVDERQAAANAAIIVNYYLESKLKGDDLNSSNLISSVNVIQHDLRDQVLQRAIDKPDNSEELLKFVYPNIGYNDGQTTVTQQDVKDYEAKGVDDVLVDDVQMQAISMQRGHNAVQSCIDYLFRRYSYVVDEAPAAALLQCVRRRSSVATRREALKRFAQTKMRSKLQGELMTCIAHSREVITSLSLTERPTSRDIRKYYHVFGLLHTHCSRLPDFDSLATVWMAADATSSAALIHALELGIKKFDNALRTTVRRATASQTEASHNAHGHLPPYDLSEAEALTALRSISRSAQTRS